MDRGVEGENERGRSVVGGGWGGEENGFRF